MIVEKKIVLIFLRVGLVCRDRDPTNFLPCIMQSRLKALVKWLRNELSVMINGIAVSRLYLPDADRKYFDGIIIRVTLYSHLTEADERELLQSLARPAWQ